LTDRQVLFFIYDQSKVRIQSGKRATRIKVDNAGRELDYYPYSPGTTTGRLYLMEFSYWRIGSIFPTFRR
jgi:hypothetical protein